MSEIRKLMETLRRIEEGHFKGLDIDIQGLRRANKDLSPVQLVSLVRQRLGQEAATYLSNQLEAEYDLADYNASNPQPHMHEDAKSEFHDKLKGTELYVGFGLNNDIKYALSNQSPRSEILGYDYSDRDNLIKVSVRDRDGNVKDMMYDKDTSRFTDPNDKDFDAWLDQNPFESIDEDWPVRKETYDEMVAYWKASLSQSIVQKGVFTKLYDAANRDIDELNAAIEDQAHSIAESYHGSDEGIGSSDVNNFIAHIASSLGIDDLFGWRKKREGIEEDEYNSEEFKRDIQNPQWRERDADEKRIRKAGLAKNKVDDLHMARVKTPKGLGTVYSINNLEPADPSFPYPTVSVRLDSDPGPYGGGRVQHRYLLSDVEVLPDEIEEGKWDYKKRDKGKGAGTDSPMYDGGAKNRKNRKAFRKAEKAKAHAARMRGELDEETELDEARGRVVEVPPELRGTDPSNEAGATSREAERFLADLGPDDDVSHDVVDPETGELLDWPTKAILKKQDDEEMEAYWRSQGGTKRQKGKRAAKNRDEFYASFNNVPSFYLHSDASGDVQERAYDLLDELRNSDFYNVVWRNVGEGFDDEEMRMAAQGDYDIDVEIPVLLKRKDGKKLTDDDHDNIKEIIKAVKAASTMGNVGIMYAGATEGGTTARFVPSFM